MKSHTYLGALILAPGFTRLISNSRQNICYEMSDITVERYIFIQPLLINILVLTCHHGMLLYTSVHTEH